MPITAAEPSEISPGPRSRGRRKLNESKLFVGGGSNMNSQRGGVRRVLACANAWGKRMKDASEADLGGRIRSTCPPVSRLFLLVS